ncbi:glycosyltransferase [Amycolatopsis panacis]|uniref:Glycosyltransferase n=1 Tax=Amycolatopsis panacis TaxID=2340917 RepID=A0A419I1F2_9PSEU|nr:glycosyltransferase [Amycolatopsis panacis]RJQ83502.1 glycosyltransferase [Amycolatopsis panacis]
MRFLFSFVGGRGHFDPMVPVAQALAARGHTVAVAGRDTHAVEQAGFPAFPVGATGVPGTARLPMPPVDPERDDWEIQELFIRRATAERTPLLVDLIREWRPDVVVRDEVDFSAALAAEKLGLPCATVLVLAAGTLLRKEVLAEPLRAARTVQCLPDDPGLAALHRDLVLSPFPPSYRDPAAPLPPGTFTFRSGAPVPARPQATRPHVYFTLGTNFNLESGDLIERALAGLGSLHADVTATVGTQLDPAGFGPQPANVRVARFVPQAELLPRLDLVVSHGGSGGVLGTLAHGLPSLLLPMGADQPGNALRGRALGTARVLDPETATPTEIREAAEDLLTDPAWRAAVQRLRAEINALPGAEDTVPLLEALVTASGHGRSRPAP